MLKRINYPNFLQWCSRRRDSAGVYKVAPSTLRVLHNHLLKTAPCRQMQHAQLTHHKWKSVHTNFYLSRSLSVQEEKAINSCALVKAGFPIWEPHSTMPQMAKAPLPGPNQGNRKTKQYSQSCYQSLACQVQGPFEGFSKSNRGIQIMQPSILPGVWGRQKHRPQTTATPGDLSVDCCAVAFPLLQSHVDNISTITAHFSLWYRHIQNALGKMPITEMLFSVALFKWASHRCHRSAQLSESGSKGSSKSISLLSYHPAGLNHSKGKPFWVMWPFLSQSFTENGMP